MSPTLPVHSASIAFDAVLTAGGPKLRNLMVAVPPGIDVKGVFGVANPAVAVHLDDRPPFEGRLAVMGGQTVFGLRQSLIAELGVQDGQRVHIRLVHDLAPRQVDLPAELTAALDAAAGARETLDALAPGQRKEFARFVGEAKKPETRDARAATAVERLLAGQKSPR